MGESDPTIHESLVPTDDAEFELRAPASVVKPIFGYADALADELRVHITEDGIHYEVVDPANVAMGGLTVPPAAFNTYDVTPTVIGTNVKTISKALRAGRKRQGDEVVLSYEQGHLSTTVQRDYDGTHMDLQTAFKTLDPDSIRQEPDIPELDWSATTTLKREMLRDAISTVNAVTDHIRFESRDNDLHIGGESDVSEASVVVSDVFNAANVGSIFSLDYLTDMLDALAAVGADEVTLSIDEEFPIHVQWTTEWNGADVSGEWFQAPRISSE